MRLRSVFVCGALAPLLIAAAEPVRLKPSSPWVVDYDRESCRLIRTFGEGKDKTKLVFESAAPGQIDMMVVGKPLETSREEVPARFLPVGGQAFDGRVARTVTNNVPAILWSSTLRLLPDSFIDEMMKEAEERRRDPSVRPPPIDLEREAVYKRQRQQFATAATELEIQTRRNRPVILETGSLGKAIEAFDRCGEDSLKDWGVDPAVEQKIVRPVWPLNPGGWLSGDDYPSEMVRRGEESEVSVRLLIDATGKVSKCTSLSHFEATEFNRITCAKIVKRARFAPAELSDGTKVASYRTERVVFRIEP